MKFRIAAAAAVSLVLAACGSTDDASTEAQADSVELPADAAMEGVDEAPVADPNANTVAAEAGEAAEEEVKTEDQQIQEAGDSAAATAEAAADAMAEDTGN